LNNIKSE